MKKAGLFSLFSDKTKFQLTRSYHCTMPGNLLRTPFGVSIEFFDFLPIFTRSIKTLRVYLILTVRVLIIYLEIKNA